MWRELRSQIMGRMSHCAARPEEDIQVGESRHFCGLAEPEPYYGPTIEARGAVNRILGLHPAADPQDWAVAIAGPGNFEMAIDELANPSLNTEERSALALLVLDSVDLIDGRGAEMLARIRWSLRRDRQVQARMRYWWTHMEGSAPVMEALR
jgi:hypothetical protein